MRLTSAVARAALGALSIASVVSRAAAQTTAAEHPYRPGIDVLHYDVALELPDSGSAIRARATLTVARDPAVDTLVLDLLDLSVDSVVVDGRSARFVRTPATIAIALPRGSTPVAVSVTYHGAVRDGLIVRTDEAGRWTAFGDNWPDRARHWIPSVDDPSDKATIDWIVDAPSDRTVIANGSLVDRRAKGTRRTITHWREVHPVPTYVMVIAAAPLVATRLGATACGLRLDGGCVDQTVYTAPEQRPSMPGAFTAAGEIVRWYASVVGPFPYEKLAHLQSETRYGGMENASAIFYADEIFRRGGVEESLIAHETAHQWFGDAVTERAWAHVWLSEGFATYFAALFAEHAHGAAAFRAAIARMRAAVLADRAAVPTRPVIDSAPPTLMALLNRNSYEKGGMVLHMLRRQVGDSAFFGALRAYYAAHRDGTALTDDLRAAMERTSGAPLAWFFDQWLRRPGYAEADVTWSYDASSHRVMLDVAQRGRFGAYRFPLVVALRDGSAVERRTTVVVPAEGAARLAVDAAAPPASLALDPDGDLLAIITLHPAP